MMEQSKEEGYLCSMRNLCEMTRLVRLLRDTRSAGGRIKRLKVLSLTVKPEKSSRTTADQKRNNLLFASPNSYFLISYLLALNVPNNHVRVIFGEFGIKILKFAK